MNLDGPKLEMYLDSLETQEPRLLLLQPLVHFIRVVTVDVGLGHQREGDTVVAFAELGNIIVGAGFLATELRVQDECVRGQRARNRHWLEHTRT